MDYQVFRLYGFSSGLSQTLLMQTVGSWFQIVQARIEELVRFLQLLQLFQMSDNEIKEMFSYLTKDNEIPI